MTMATSSLSLTSNAPRTVGSGMTAYPRRVQGAGRYRGAAPACVVEADGTPDVNGAFPVTQP